MIRYRLDDLGPYQFEKLVQSLLKSACGLGMESWGNRGDLGRDAYAPGELRFPDQNRQQSGPFVFQVKLVEGANEAGARPEAALISSARKEVAEIARRLANRVWEPPRHFTFITNAPIRPSGREKIRQMFQVAVRSAEIHVWGGDDVCDLLDQYPQITRAFPQLLSIRDLDALIGRALNKASRERSDGAIELARELVPVFAPTSAYERAWKVLAKHHFVVLEGPPEVGKSAIAWMIGLSQVAVGWESIVCRTPETFFHSIEAAARQVFIADDAFGRTEYDPARTSLWEVDLDLILHRLGPRHWLVWTSRKHILERACQRMDAQGKARSFPDPAAVLVDVENLTVEERALILFRHAKTSALDSDTKNVIRRHASMIVFDREFTPERIRRLIHENLPGILSSKRQKRLDESEVGAAIREALRNPTRQMRVAFQNLPHAYKWFLVALLEISETGLSYKGNIEPLSRLYDDYCPEAHREPFDRVLQHLTEAFVKRRDNPIGAHIVDWIHPSYRDLVIEELIEDADLRNTFLRRASLEGIKLAVSDTGGEVGKRRQPFMRSAESWDILNSRCLALVDSRMEIRELLQVLASAASQGTTPDTLRRWKRLISSVCGAVATVWNEDKAVFSALDIAAFLEARSAVKVDTPLPDLDPSWEALETKFLESARAAPADVELNYGPFDEIAAFAEAIQGVAADFLELKGFPERFDTELALILEKAAEEGSARYYLDDAEEMRGLASRMESIASSVERLGGISDKFVTKAKSTAKLLISRSAGLEGEAAAAEPGEEEPDRDEGHRSQSELFDIGRLFSEL